MLREPTLDLPAVRSGGDENDRFALPQSLARKVGHDPAQESIVFIKVNDVLRIHH